jgi:hypothetical protein
MSPPTVPLSEARKERDELIAKFTTLMSHDLDCLDQNLTRGDVVGARETSADLRQIVNILVERFL